MNKKIAAVVIIVIAFVGVILLTGGFEFSFSTANISNITMAKEIDNQNRPVETASEFNSTAPRIYITMKLSNAPQDTQVKSEWYYVENNAEIDSYSLTTDGTRNISFKLTRFENEFPAGNYRVDILLDGEKVNSKEFDIKETYPQIIDTALAKGITDNYEPINETYVFNTDETVYFTGKISNPVKGTELSTEWYDEEGNLIFSFNDNPLVYEQSVSGEDNFYFNYEPENNWTSGKYSVKLNLNGENVETVEFEVKQ